MSPDDIRQEFGGSENEERICMADPNSANTVAVFPPQQCWSLADLSPSDLLRHYGEFELLLVRTEDQVAVAGCTINDRRSLQDAFRNTVPDGSLIGYAVQHGPRPLGRAVDQIDHRQREAERSSPPPTIRGK